MRTSARKPLEVALGIFERRYDRLVRLRHEYREDLNLVGVELLTAAIHATAVDIEDMKTAIGKVRR